MTPSPGSVRLTVLFLAGLALAPPPAAGAASNSRPPNVILIMADDIGRECYGAYGSRQYRTPEIDRLASEGVRFEQCHVQPLCTPTRIKLMTGRSNVRNYSGFSILNRDQRTIGEYFRDAGFATMVAGKWQLLGAEHYSARFRGKGTWPHEAGFDRTCLWQVDQLGSRYWSPLLYIDGKNRQFGPDDYGPELCARAVLDFISAQRDRPFFVYYPMILVHDPFEPTPHSSSRQSTDKQRNFEDMVAYMDHIIGRIVKKVDELGLAERTLILVLGDNGTHPSIRSELGGRIIKGGKGTTTDAGTRVALFARWKGTIPAGRVSHDLVDASDFLPTTLEAARIPIPAGLDGRSFLPQLRGEKGTPREWIHIWYNPRPERTSTVRFVRDHRWKLYGDGRLFDVTADELELSPIADAPPGSPADLARQKLAAALASFPAEGQTLLQFPTQRGP